MTTFERLKEVVNAGKFLILDTETTGLEGEVCQIALVNQDGEVLYDGLVKPARTIPWDATAVHGITNDMVANAPSWGIVRERILSLIVASPVLVYNAAFDVKIMHISDRRAGLSRYQWWELASWECAMTAYAEHYGEWNDYHQNYRWQRLTDACSQQGIAVANAHSALGDCQMTLALVKKIAQFNSDWLAGAVR